MDPQTIATYSARAAAYAEFGIGEVQARAMAQFAAALPEGGAVLDYGCGPGVQGAALLARGFRVSGLDATPEFVAAAQARGIAARLGTFEDLVEVQAYDGIWASFSLLHAARADFARHLAAMARALRPGGAVYLGMKTGTGARRDALGRFYTFYSVAELRAALEAVGLGVIWEEAGSEAGFAGTVDPFVMMVAQDG